ncbi:MAG: D-ribose pyranase [Thermomicrobiales bacterium]
MRKSGLQHGRLSAIVAAMGHGDLLVIADPGLPIPPRVECVDLAVTAGVPPFLDVLRAISAELAMEKIVIAAELQTGNPALDADIQTITGMSGQRRDIVSHEVFKQMTETAVAIVRTGEFTPYANVILVGGVAF